MQYKGLDGGHASSPCDSYTSGSVGLSVDLGVLATGGGEYGGSLIGRVALLDKAMGRGLDEKISANWKREIWDITNRLWYPLMDSNNNTKACLSLYWMLSGLTMWWVTRWHDSWDL